MALVGPREVQALRTKGGQGKAENAGCQPGLTTQTTPHSVRDAGWAGRSMEPCRRAWTVAKGERSSDNLSSRPSCRGASDSNSLCREGDVGVWARKRSCAGDSMQKEGEHGAAELASLARSLGGAAALVLKHANPERPY